MVSRILVTIPSKIELMSHVMRMLCIKRIRTRNYTNSAEKMPRWKLARQKRQDSEFGEPCNQNFYKRNSLIHKDEEICRMLRSTCSGNDPVLPNLDITKRDVGRI